jgi:hypothetical protein
MSVPLVELESPGGNSFLRASEALSELAGAGRDPQRCAELAVEAIAAAIMTEMVALWGARSPRDWSAWYENALSGRSTRSPDFLVAMMKDGEVAQVELTGWRTLESELRRRIQGLH